MTIKSPCLVGKCTYVISKNVQTQENLLFDAGKSVASRYNI